MTDKDPLKGTTWRHCYMDTPPGLITLEEKILAALEAFQEWDHYRKAMVYVYPSVDGSYRAKMLEQRNAETALALARSIKEVLRHED